MKYTVAGTYSLIFGAVNIILTYIMYRLLWLMGNITGTEKTLFGADISPSQWISLVEVMVILLPIITILTLVFAIVGIVKSKAEQDNKWIVLSIVAVIAAILPLLITITRIGIVAYFFG